MSRSVCPQSPSTEHLRQMCLDKFVLTHKFSRKYTCWTWHGKVVWIFVLTGNIPWWKFTKICHTTQSIFSWKIQLISPLYSAIITFNLQLFPFLFIETLIFWLWVHVHTAKSTKTPMTTWYSTLWASYLSLTPPTIISTAMDVVSDGHISWVYQTLTPMCITLSLWKC